MNEKIKQPEMPPLPPLPLESREEMVKVLTTVMTKERAEQLIERFVTEISSGLDKTIRPALLNALQANMESLGYTPEISLFAKSLAEQAGISRLEAYVKGLALFKMAIDATREGHKIVVVDSDDTIVREIIGADTPFQIGSPVAG